MRGVGAWVCVLNPLAPLAPLSAAARMAGRSGGGAIGPTGAPPAAYRPWRPLHAAAGALCRRAACARTPRRNRYTRDWGPPDAHRQGASPVGAGRCAGRLLECGAAAGAGTTGDALSPGRVAAATVPVVRAEPEPPPTRPAVAWLAQAAVPFGTGGISAWSKNRTWRHGRGNTYLAPAARMRHRLVRDAVARSLGDRRLQPERPFWIAVHVAKPDHRGDAANVLDLVLDAVQAAARVDDRWAALWGLTWSIEPDAPAVTVWLGQEPGAADPRPPRRRAPRRRRPPPEPPSVVDGTAPAPWV